MLDALIRAMRGARNKLVNLEEMTDAELDKLQAEFQKVCGARKSKSAETPSSNDLLPVPGKTIGAARQDNSV